MLASLMVVAALVFLLLTAWLPLLRRMITPTVSGTVLMLITATVLPIALDRVQEVPEGSSMAAGPIVAAVTLVASALLALRASGPWRLFTPVLGIAFGCAVAVLFDLYEFQGLARAAWAGVPWSGFAGLDLTPGADFWALLPAFVVVTLVVGIKGIGTSVAVQQASRRRPRATDFRMVQGAMTTNGWAFCCAAWRGFCPPRCPGGGPSRSSPSPEWRRGAPATSSGSPSWAGLLPQGNGYPGHYPQPGHGRLPAHDDGDALRRGDPDSHARRPRLEEGAHCRHGVRDGARA